MMKYFAGVITGDLVGSTELNEPTRREALTVLESCLSGFDNHASSEMYRGDAFQLFTTSPSCLLFMTFKIRLSLIARGVDARLSLAVAESEPLEMPVRMANNSAAFTLSGRQLDEMKSRRLAFIADEETLSQDVSIVMAYADDALNQMTAKMAQALLVWIENPALQHIEFAEKLGVSRSAFTRIINRANYGRVGESMKWFEKRIARYTEL